MTNDVHVWQGDVEILPPDYPGRGRPRKYPVELPSDDSVLEVAKNLPDDSWLQITWREGKKGPMTGRFAAVWVRRDHPRLETA
ncbi:MAG: hypothetical protein ACYDDH_04185 [Candidatus Desulforudaceae bacterium]